jgi:hypothetical protein
LAGRASEKSSSRCRRRVCNGSDRKPSHKNAREDRPTTGHAAASLRSPISTTGGRIGRTGLGRPGERSGLLGLGRVRKDDKKRGTQAETSVASHGGGGASARLVPRPLAFPPPRHQPLRGRAARSRAVTTTRLLVQTHAASHLGGILTPSINSPRLTAF